MSLTEPSPNLTAASDSIAVQLPTPYGVFAAHAFERPSGHVYLALVFGDVDGADDVLVRVHSECLTGDALGSLRCDCGVQLRESLRSIVANGCGALVYATGHEGRGIGLMNKLRAYLEQEHGADTVDANHLLGLPADARDYGDAAHVIRSLGIVSVRLMTNNPTKAVGLREHGVDVTEVVPIHTAPHHHNTRYMTTKMERMGHVEPVRRSDGEVPPIDDAATLLGAPPVRPAGPGARAGLRGGPDRRRGDAPRSPARASGPAGDRGEARAVARRTHRHSVRRFAVDHGSGGAGARAPRARTGRRAGRRRRHGTAR